jgi:hypothetical protein
MKTTAQQTIDLVKELKIKPQKAINHLKVSLGEMVKAGQVLAEKKGIFRKKTIKAEVNSRVELLKENGELLLVAIEEGKTETVEGKPAVGKSAGHSQSASLVIFDQQKTAADLNSDYEEKLLVCDFPASDLFVYKAEAIGVSSLAFFKEEKDDYRPPENLQTKIYILDRSVNPMEKLVRLIDKPVLVRHGQLTRANP